MTTFVREDTRSVSLTIDGKDFGICEARTGGAGDSEEAKPRLGGMGPQVALGGPATTENVTVEKLYDSDGIGQDLAWLYARRGKGRCVVTEQPLDGDGNVHGRRLTWTGVLKSVNPGDYDAQGSDESSIEMEISTDGPVA